MKEYSTKTNDLNSLVGSMKSETIQQQVLKEKEKLKENSFRTRSLEYSKLRFTEENQWKTHFDTYESLSNLKNIRMQTEFDKTKVLPNIILPNLNYPENPWQKIQSDFTFAK